MYEEDSEKHRQSVLVRTWTVDHISPLLRSLQQLPVSQSIDFKILLWLSERFEAKKIYFCTFLLLLGYEASGSPGTGLLVRTKPAEAQFSLCFISQSFRVLQMQLGRS